MTARSTLDPSDLDAALLAWFDRHGRRLAFRASGDPYGVLVSEVMLQQTQVGRIEVAWPAFMARFPTLHALADAPVADVLRAWAGLGYNRRALNLQRAAALVVAEHDGRLPSDVRALERLPGVGPYTARAVATIAFGARTAAVDTNVRRVLGRVLSGHGFPGDPGRPLPPAELQRRADELVDAARPADWTHAVMDVGSGPCRPRRPSCEECPLEAWCDYAALTRHAPAATHQPARVPLRPAADSVAHRGRADSGVGAHGGASGSRRSPATPQPPFRATTRWLRGRIVERLREAPDGTWQRIDPPIGSHGEEAVRAALAGLRRDGLLELDPEGRARLPFSPTAGHPDGRGVSR